MKLIVLVVILSLCSGARSNRDTFMVNGFDVHEAVPFYAYLEIFRYPDYAGDTYFGGGTLISESNILTVAQNVFGFKSWRAGLGSYTIDGLEWYSIRSAIIHPDYNSSDLANNIAILILNKPISSLAENIHPILLVPGGSHFPHDGVVGHIVGFGFGVENRQPDQLQYARMTVMSQEDCGVAYPHLIQNGQLENHFCARNLTTGTNICGGDQGGPIYSPERHLMIGVQSFNRVKNCSLPESGPAAFIMISRYVAWINEYSGQNN